MPSAKEQLDLVRSYVEQQRAMAREVIRRSDPENDDVMWAHVLEEELGAILELMGRE